MTYCRGYSGGKADVRKTRQVPTRHGAQRFPPHLSAVILLQSRHLSAAAPPPPGPPRPRLSPSAQVALVPGSPSQLRVWAAQPHATQSGSDYKPATTGSPFWNATEKLTLWQFFSRNNSRVTMRLKVHFLQLHWIGSWCWQPTSACACSPDPAVWWAWPSAWCVAGDHLSAAPVCGNEGPFLTPEPGGEVGSESTNHEAAATLIQQHIELALLVGRMRRNKRCSGVRTQQRRCKVLFSSMFHERSCLPRVREES